MKRIYAIGIGCIIISILAAFYTPSKKTKTSNMNNSNPIVTFETNYGSIKILLYNETPLHRDNFLKLAEEHYYDSLLFHRVIDGFMIQTGDPNSKNAAAGTQLGFGGPGYTIPAEFNTNFIHKKGALAAARLGGPNNPNKESSGSQFYIVVGQTVTKDQITVMENNQAGQKKQEFLNNELYKPENKSVLDTLISLQNANKRQEFIAVFQEFANHYNDTLSKIQTNHYSEEQKEIYATIGGTPHLDMEYTVFGEVIEGLNVVDSIAKVATDKANRPLDDVMITKVSVEK